MNASPLIIKNKFLEVRCDQATGAISVKHLKTGKVFITDGRLADTIGKATIWSAGKKTDFPLEAIQILYSNGTTMLELLPKLPFVLITSSISNSEKQPLHLRNYKAADFSLDLGKQAAGLRILGSGGLKKADENVGSFDWISIAEPFARSGLVAGWITHDKASGVLFSNAQNGKLQVSARSDFGNLNIAPGKTVPLDTLAVGYFEDARHGLEAFADYIAEYNRIKLPPPPVVYCTWYHAGASNEKDLIHSAEIAAEKLKPYGFSVMQIDDGWQDGASHNGPHKNFTQVKPNGPYSDGMKPVADAVVAKGLTPGIWFMPFSGNDDDPFWADKRDFFYKTKEGKPFSTNWSGTLVDPSVPDFQKFLVEEIKRFRAWGYTYFKMDGLHSGSGAPQTYPNMWFTEDNFGEAIVSNPDKTNIEAYREGLSLIRKTAGKDVFILGCCSSQNMRSYGGVFGLVDGMRVGPDNGGDWHGWLTSPTALSSHYFLNGRVWWDDPDPVYLRTSIPIEQVKTMCSWQAMTGMLTSISDSLGDLPAERLDIARRIMPIHRAAARPVDVFESNVPRVWLVTDSKSGVKRDVVGLFNWANEPLKCDYDLAYLGLDPKVKYAAYDFWNNELITIQGKLETQLPPTSCKILAIRPVANHPFLISTNRHITQGIVDVLEEKWNAGSNTLSGRSLVVGNDPYELRIVASVRASAASVSPADTSAGVKISLIQNENGLVRVLISSNENREVKWNMSFKQGGK